MNELLGKISSYNLFNYLFSGVLFVVLLDAFTSYSLMQEDWVIGLFLYYFIGLLVSRIGSIIIDPILKKISFIKFKEFEYKDYVTASKQDSTIEILSEVNNTYRTLVAVCVSLLSLKVYELFRLKFPVTSSQQVYFLLVFLLIMFLFAYRKQSAYITRRIEANLKKQ